MKLKYKLCCIWIIAISLGSCWVPIFDEKISTGALLAGKMTKGAQIGPINMQYNEFLNMRFVPSWVLLTMPRPQKCRPGPVR